MFTCPTLVASDETIEKAKMVRQQRMREFDSSSNYIIDKPTDKRWVGDLGEFGFARWLSDHNVDYQWITEGVGHAPDYIINGCIRLDLKTCPRPTPVKQDWYCVEIGAHNLVPEKAKDWYFFASFQIAEKRLWLLGGMRHQNVLDTARFYPCGSVLTEGSQYGGVKRMPVRAKLGTYALLVRELVPPNECIRQWLEEAKNSIRRRSESLTF